MQGRAAAQLHPALGWVDVGGHCRDEAVGNRQVKDEMAPLLPAMTEDMRRSCHEFRTLGFVDADRKICGNPGTKSTTAIGVLCDEVVTVYADDCDRRDGDCQEERQRVRPLADRLVAPGKVRPDVDGVPHLHSLHTRRDRVASLPPFRSHGAAIQRAPPLGPNQALPLHCGTPASSVAGFGTASSYYSHIKWERSRFSGLEQKSEKFVRISHFFAQALKIENAPTLIPVVSWRAGCSPKCALRGESEAGGFGLWR